MNTKKENFLWQKVLIKLVTLLLVLFILNVFQVQIRNLFYAVSYPVSNIFLESGKNTSGFLSSFTNFNAFKKENDNLKEENQKLLSEISVLQSNLMENQDLKTVSQNIDNNFKMILTRIVALDLANDAMVIDKGSNDGVLENMPIISSQKVVYGKVLKVYKNFSQISLISSKNSTIDVKIQTDDMTKKPVYGALKGAASLSVYLDLVSADSIIKEGDIIVTSGLEGTFPKDLLIGKVVSVSKNDLKPFQTAQVQPFFDLKNTENLFVIVNYLKK